MYNTVEKLVKENNIRQSEGRWLEADRRAEVAFKVSEATSLFVEVIGKAALKPVPTPTLFSTIATVTRIYTAFHVGDHEVGLWGREPEVLPVFVQPRKKIDRNEYGYDFYAQTGKVQVNEWLTTDENATNIGNIEAELSSPPLNIRAVNKYDRFINCSKELLAKIEMTRA